MSPDSSLSSLPHCNQPTTLAGLPPPLLRMYAVCTRAHTHTLSDGLGAVVGPDKQQSPALVPLWLSSLHERARPPLTTQTAMQKQTRSWSGWDRPRGLWERSGPLSVIKRWRETVRKERSQDVPQALRGGLHLPLRLRQRLSTGRCCRHWGSQAGSPLPLSPSRKDAGLRALEATRLLFSPSLCVSWTHPG